MKKKIFTKKVFIIIAPIVILLIVIFYLFSIPVIQFHYDTFDEAVAHDYTINIKSKEGIVEDNNVKFLIYKGHDNVFSTQKYVEDEKGWISPPSSGLPKKTKIFPGTTYTLEYYKYSKKHIICIMGVKNEVFTVNDPTDSIGSEFKHFSKTIEDIDMHYWFLVLDELPENYSLKIGDETVSLN